jgi:hypothetical protein
VPPSPHKILAPQPLYIFFSRDRKKESISITEGKRGWEMKKDGVTLKSHDPNGCGVLKWRVQFFFFIFMYLFEAELSGILRE